MNYRIIITYVALLSVFGFLAFAYVHYQKPHTYLINPSPTADKTTTDNLLNNKPVASNYLTKEEAEDLIKTTIKDNPELLLRTINEYHNIKRKEALEEAKRRVMQNLTAIENNVDDPRVGEANARVKIVEFFDYNCGYCKHMAAIKAKILEENPDVQYVFKEYPILGESSILQAKAALTVYAIDKEKYLPFHIALLNSSDIKTEEQIIEVAGTLGIDIEKMRATLHNSKWNDIISSNMNLAREIGVMGTPGYVIGGELFPGALSYDEIKVKVNAARIRLGVAEPAEPKPQKETAPAAPTAPANDSSAEQKSEATPEKVVPDNNATTAPNAANSPTNNDDATTEPEPEPEPKQKVEHAETTATPVAPPADNGAVVTAFAAAAPTSAATAPIAAATDNKAAVANSSETK